MDMDMDMPVKMDYEVDESDNEGDGLDDSSDSRDITTIRVQFLGKWHDIVIDWNDDKEYKQDQIFEQLAEITGIFSQLITYIGLYKMRPVNPRLHPGDFILYHIRNNDYHTATGDTAGPGKLVKEDVIDSCIQDGERFYLKYSLYFEPYIIMSTAINFMLVPEILVIEGECNGHLCQTTNTEPFFNRVKNIILNDPLNDEITDRIEPFVDSDDENDLWYDIAQSFYKEYNILQFFDVACSSRVHVRNNIFDASDESLEED